MPHLKETIIDLFNTCCMGNHGKMGQKPVNFQVAKFKVQQKQIPRIIGHAKISQLTDSRHHVLMDEISKNDIFFQKYSYLMHTCAA